MVGTLRFAHPTVLPIDKVFAFDDIGKAFEHMEANRHLGKIVVTL